MQMEGMPGIGEDEVVATVNHLKHREAASLDNITNHSRADCSSITRNKAAHPTQVLLVSVGV